MHTPPVRHPHTSRKKGEKRKTNVRRVPAKNALNNVVTTTTTTTCFVQEKKTLKSLVVTCVGEANWKERWLQKIIVFSCSFDRIRTYKRTRKTCACLLTWETEACSWCTTSCRYYLLLLSLLPQGDVKHCSSTSKKNKKKSRALSLQKTRKSCAVCLVFVLQSWPGFLVVLLSQVFFASTGTSISPPFGQTSVELVPAGDFMPFYFCDKATSMTYVAQPKEYQEEIVYKITRPRQAAKRSETIGGSKKKG